MTTRQRPQAIELIDADTIRNTIARALDAPSLLPPYSELERLQTALREHIRLLLPLVQVETDKLNRGIARWHERQTVIDEARHTLRSDMGPGLMSAAVHVHELGRSCCILLAYQQGEDQ